VRDGAKYPKNTLPGTLTAQASLIDLPFPKFPCYSSRLESSISPGVNPETLRACGILKCGVLVEFVELLKTNRFDSGKKSLHNLVSLLMTQLTSAPDGAAVSQASWRGWWCLVL